MPDCGSGNLRVGTISQGRSAVPTRYLKDQPPAEPTAEVRRAMDRRRFLQRALAGTVVASLAGVLYGCSDDAATSKAAAQVLPGGKPRLPPGQRVIQRLKPMGGQEGDPSPAK